MKNIHKNKKLTATKPKILVVLGPTAVGKSDLAVKLAKLFNGEIISADSRQVYKGMDIGTGKITKKEMKGVPHYLLDVLSPIGKLKRFAVADFQRISYEKIDDILKRGKLPIICGGTGFYIQSVVDGTVLPEVTADLKLRKKLEHKSPEELVKILSKLDKNRLKNIDVNNRVRLIRAIEIATAIGKVPKIINKPKYDAFQIGLDISDETLRVKIIKRIASRLNIGMITEAKHLHAAGLSYKRMREFGLEYRHLANLLESGASIKKPDVLIEFSQLLELDIWHYAKRQRAWFKRDARIVWKEPNEQTEIIKLTKKFLS